MKKQADCSINRTSDSLLKLPAKKQTASCVQRITAEALPSITVVAEKDRRYDDHCHFKATRRAKRADRSIRGIIESRWSIWPAVRLEQASLKVKNFARVRARHAQPKRPRRSERTPSAADEGKLNPAFRKRKKKTKPPKINKRAFG